MKRKYITPEIEIFNIQAGGTLLAGSVTLTPKDWTGGGEAASPLFNDDSFNLIMGGDDFSDFEKLLDM